MSIFRETIKSIRNEIYELENVVFPVFKNLPNVLDAEPDADTDARFENVLRTSKRSPNERKSFKQLDFVKLCYINSGFYSSIISPDGLYLIGKMAVLHDKLISEAEKCLQLNDYVEISGLDFVKSGVIEATSDESVIDH